MPDELFKPKCRLYCLMIEVFIRRPQSRELKSVRAVVQTVVDEVYGGIWAPPPVPVDEEGWQLSWVAVVNEKIVGVVLTSAEWLDDLWVLRDNRGCGIGKRLLALGEAEIVARDHETLRLRVLQSNEVAIGFYRRQGWQIARAFPHEKFPITMLEMFKSVRQNEK
jgi:ribosomal protein S18 acetylase RimI-like enzyme